MNRSKSSGFMLAAGLCALALGAFVSSDVNVVSGATEPVHLDAVANLTGASVVPGPGDSDGAGTSFASFNSDGVSANFCLYFSGLTGIEVPTGGGLYAGPAGVSGALVYDFGTNSFPCDGLDPVVAADLIANPGNYYIRVDTLSFPNGAIRGQLATDHAENVCFAVLATPLRSYDSRVDGTKMGSSETRNISLLFGKDGVGVSQIAVPVGSYAADIVITVTQTSPQGYLATHAAGTPVPPTSTINWSLLNSNVATSATVRVDGTSRVAVTSGPGANTHVIIDIVGYYSPNCVS